MPVRIGIVDTGVDREHWCFEGPGPEGIGVRRRGDDYGYEPDFHDLHGHGTAIASLICSYCRKAHIHAVRIAQQDGEEAVVRVQERALALGINWCVEQGIRIVNVSYSIAEAAEGGLLARACRRAHQKDVILVASYRNGENGPVYPAAFPTVIGVRRNNRLKPGQVAILDQNNFDLCAWGKSNSDACAAVSAMVGRIHSVDDCLGLKEVFAFLMEVSV